MGVKFVALKMIWEVQKHYTNVYIFFIFKTKVIFMFKFYIFTPFTSINHILLI
jgi:hypothetical protein